MESEYITVEYCTNCANHRTHTRHNEQKYSTVFHNLKRALSITIPGISILANSIPQSWKEFKLYSNLWDISQDLYLLEPKLGAFEVSHEGNVS